MPLAPDWVAADCWTAIAVAPVAVPVGPARRINARHSGASRNPAPLLLLLAEVQGFHSPCGRAGHFLCLCKESNQRNTPPVARSPGILPSDFANGLRGSLNAHPCACSELARILRATLRAFPAPARRATGAPLGGILPQRQRQQRALPSVDLSLTRPEQQEDDSASQRNRASHEERNGEAAGAIDEPAGHEYAEYSGEGREGVADSPDHAGVARSDVEAVRCKAGVAQRKRARCAAHQDQPACHRWRAWQHDKEAAHALVGRGRVRQAYLSGAGLRWPQALQVRASTER